MRVEVNVLESGTAPRVSVQHQPALMMALRTGSIEVGSRCSEMMRFTFGGAKCAWSLVMSRHGFERMTCTICICPSTSRTPR